MLAVLAIYLLGIALCLLAGVAICGLTDPDGPWLGARTLPLGLGTLIVLLYFLGAALPGTQAAPVAVVIVLAGVGGAVWRQRRRSGGAPLVPALRRAAHVTRDTAIALGGAVVAGLLLLLPTMKQGFPTTIAVHYSDGWGYASAVEWFKDHPVPRTVTPDIDRPLTIMAEIMSTNHFGIGFEHFATLLASLLGRDGFEVVNAAAAVAIAAAVGGWVMLANDINPRLGGLETGLVVFAVATPVLAVPFAANAATQFVSLCLWPVALSAFLRFSRRPGLGRLIVAGIGVGAVVGVYPAVLPWLVLPLIAVAAFAPAQPTWAATRLRGLAGARPRERAVRAAALLGALVVALMVVVPIPMVRWPRNLLFLDLFVAGGGTFFSTGGYAAYAVGATKVFSLDSLAPLTWSIIAALVLMVVAYVVAVVPWYRPRGTQLLLLAVAAGVLVTTAAVVFRYRVLNPLPYQTYKGLTSGAAIFAGLILLGLVTTTASRGRTIRLLSVGCVIAVWVPVTSSVLQTSTERDVGFRAADVQMGRALRALPGGSVVLVEGAAPDERSFQLRMMAAYFGTQGSDLTTIGLGSTASYFTPGGGVEWRPGRPWTDVLSTRAQPIATRRAPVWSNAVYSLTAAPPLDMTTFGTGWYPPESDGTTVFAWTSAAAELVISNRTARARPVRLEFSASSYARPRTLTVATPRGAARQRLAADVMTPVSVDLMLPADSAIPVTLKADPGATTAPPGDGRQLLVRFQELRVMER